MLRHITLAVLALIGLLMECAVSMNHDQAYCSRTVKGLYMEMYERQPSTSGFRHYNEKCMNGSDYYRLYAGVFMHSRQRLKAKCGRMILENFRYVLQRMPSAKDYSEFVTICLEGKPGKLINEYISSKDYMAKERAIVMDPIGVAARRRPQCYYKIMAVFQATVKRPPTIDEYRDIFITCIDGAKMVNLYKQVMTSNATKSVVCRARASHIARFLFGRYPSQADYAAVVPKCMTFEPHIDQLQNAIDSKEFRQRYLTISPKGI